MLNNWAINISVFGAFVLMVAVLGFFLWQTLFASEEYRDSKPEAEPAYEQQESGSKNPLGAGSAPSTKENTDKAIVRYTKWLAIFTTTAPSSYRAGMELYLLGAFGGYGVLNTQYITLFIQRYDLAERRFVPVEPHNPDYDKYE